jgi:hypothetical protein
MQNGEEGEAEEISPTLSPFSKAFSVFDTVEWSERTSDDWKLFGRCGFSDIVYHPLASEVDQMLLARALHREAIAAAPLHNRAICN